MKSFRKYLDLVKFEHTIFALPFAFLGMLVAQKGFPTFETFFWITISMASARTLAMGSNRIADRWIDARNPRTEDRPLVSGEISLHTAFLGTGISAIILAIGAWKLGELTLSLLPGAYILLIGYSFTKRFTWLSHLILGATDGLAPLGAWAAVRGTIFSAEDLPAWLLFLVVTFWITGFDIIYALQDLEVDKLEGLHSLPKYLGSDKALISAAVLHVIMMLILAAFGLLLNLSWPFWVGYLIIAGLLRWEHQLVEPDDLSRIDQAFFNINSYISVTLFASVIGAMFFV